MKTYLDYIDEKLFTKLILLTMFSIPLLEFIGIFLNIKYFFQEQILSILAFINCFVLLFYFIKKIIKKTASTKLVLSDIFIILCFLFCIISLIFSNNFFKSFFGEYGYSETIFNMLGYFTLFFLCTLINSDENKTKIFKGFIILCILETLVAFLQNFNLWPIQSYFNPEAHKIWHFAFGFTQHCNFYAGLSIIFTGIAAGAYMYQTKHNKFYLILSVLACLGTLFTYTRLAWVGIFTILFGIGIIHFTISKKNDSKEFSRNKNKFIILIVVFIICFLIVGIISGQLLRDLLATTSEFSDLESFGTNRGRIWKVGFYALKDNLLTGIGFDDYRHAYDLYPIKYEITQNKGHNEYIHTFVTQGVPAGINYILFSIYCFLYPFKKLHLNNSKFSTSPFTKIFLIALFAYLVQALFNSSINNVAPYKWILMGLLLPRIEQQVSKK